MFPGSLFRTTPRMRVAAASLAAVLGAALALPAGAQVLAQAAVVADAVGSADMVIPAELPEQDTVIASQPTGFWTGVDSRSNLLGDMGGLRGTLARKGVTLGLSEVSDVLGTLSGGIASGQGYHGLTTLTVGVDAQQALGWRGGSANLSALQIHGLPFSAQYVGSLQTASGTEADPTTRLWEAWYQQKWREGQVDLRVGQQSLDQEFMVSQYAGIFMGTMFGWPAVPSYDMTSGGPAYPLSALGARVHASLGHQINVLLGVYAGNPAGSTGSQDPQKVDDTGTNFSTSGGKLWIGEIQFGRNQPDLGEMDTGKPRDLPGMYKLGAWYQDASFADLSLDGQQRSLASPLSNGVPLQHAGNYSFYLVADQMVLRDAEDDAFSVNVFARLMTAPGDRNQISASANLGITVNAPFEGRDADVAGLGLAWVQVGSGAADLVRNTNAFDGSALPVPNTETFVEATYMYQFKPWWQLQGSLQYTLHPGGGAVDPNDVTQTRAIPDAWVLGLRTSITF